MRKEEKFPSPYGAYFFELDDVMELLNISSKKKFPSPYGAYFFEIDKIEHNQTQYYSGISFRPLTGIIFLNWMKKLVAFTD